MPCHPNNCLMRCGNTSRNTNFQGKAFLDCIFDVFLDNEMKSKSCFIGKTGTSPVQNR